MAGLKHHLYPAEDFIELILAELRIRLAEIRPGMNVVHHQLEIVSADVVVEAAQDRIDDRHSPFVRGLGTAIEPQPAASSESGNKPPLRRIRPS